MTDVKWSGSPSYLHSALGLARQGILESTLSLRNLLSHFFFPLNYFLKSYLYIYLDKESHNAAQAGLDLKIFLPQFSKCTTMTEFAYFLCRFLHLESSFISRLKLI